MPRLPSILTESSFVIVNVAAAQAQGDAFAQKPVLTGPFSIDSFSAHQEAVLVRNPQYWGAAPKAERVAISDLSDANARMLGLQSGQLDIAIDIRPESVAIAAGDPNLRVVPAQPVSTIFMYLNQKKPVWQGSEHVAGASLCAACARCAAHDRAAPAGHCWGWPTPAGSATLRRAESTAK